MSLNTLAVSKNAKEYKCRKPQYGPYYQCIEDNCEMKYTRYGASIFGDF